MFAERIHYHFHILMEKTPLNINKLLQSLMMKNNEEFSFLFNI